MRKSRILFLISLFVFLSVFTVRAEEQRDLREGITGEVSSETEWGLLPRFKMNPDTGLGTGLKLKGQNIFGTSLLLDLANIYTTNEFQIYEFLLMLPRLGDTGKSWFYMSGYAEYDMIPDYRFFGVGNDTENEMFDTDDNVVADESSFQYEMLLGRLSLGWHPAANLYIALEPFYKEVWLDNGDNDDLPNGMIKYAGLPGTEGGTAHGMSLAVIYATRDDQWRPTKGKRVELRFEDVGPYFGADYNFSRYLLDARQYIRLFGKYNILALHLRLETLEGIDSEIPWWELSQIGGRDSLRGFWEGRFRGKSSVLANAEFRYHILDLKPKRFKFIDFVVDGNVFVDLGQVFLNEKEMDESLNMDYKQTYGFGFRFTTPPNLMGRMDIGVSKEQDFATYFNFGTVF